MSEILLKWLNNDIILSKKIKDISEDFRNGYLFAELLYKTKQVQKLSNFKDSNDKKDIIHNFCLLNKTLLDMGIILNEKDRNEIINGGTYASKIYLLKIRQVLDKKCIDLEQLKYKYSNDLQLLYNKMCFKNENEKYLYNLKIRLENSKNNSNMLGSSKLINMTEGKTKEQLLEQKYSLKGSICKELKKKYSHLELTDFELEIILNDMREEEIKLNYLKEKVQKTEKAREKLRRSKEKKEIKNWGSSIIEIKKNKNNLLRESWEPVRKYQKGFINYLKKNALKNAKITNIFDKELNFFVSEKGEHDEEDEIDIKKSMDLKNEIYMRQIKEKLEEKIKSKKDREKRERKRLKEERDMYERLNTEKNMSDMIKHMEKNINKVKVVSIKGDELTAKTEQLLREVSPIERRRIKKLDEIILNEIDKENRIDEEINKNGVKEKIQNINMNITKLIEKKKEKEKIKIEEKEKNELENIDKEKDEKGENEEKEEEDNNENKIEEKSIYSKLTTNDFGLNLIDEAFNIHNKVNINDRTKLFKTRIAEESEKKYKDLPKLPDISGLEEDSISKEQKSLPNILDKKDINNKSFDKESFYEEMNKLNYVNFMKSSEERKIKKEKKNKLIKPIIEKIIEITEYIHDYQEIKGVKLLDNSKWDEIMDKFINFENIKDEEKDEIISEEEVSEYLFDYGEKLNEVDKLILFDYMNYLNIYNDLIIPTSIRGKRYKYYELYEDIYNLTNNEVDIKEYEPNEEEIENLILPKTPYSPNYKFFDIIENAIKHKYNKKNNLNLINKNDIYSQKGKYYYLPIKISVTGYPMSGKKSQSQLINNKYQNIKLFDPEKILENKLEEYKELKEPVEKTTKSKNMKPNQLEQLNKEREEKLEKFTPILNIIKPYLDYLENNNEQDLNDTDNKEDILADVYINLLIYELNKEFPDDIESKNKLLEELNNKYKQYISIKDQIKEIERNEEENKKETDEKNKNKKGVQNYSKDIELLNKQLESIIPSLYVGFIFINFPKNEKQAKKLENIFTGYISEFEKDKDIIEEKIFNYNNILDINIKQNENKLLQISMFDLFINLKITSEEADNRYNDIRYDPTTKKIYNLKDIPSNDKKLIERLLPGIPDFSKDKMKYEKELYEGNIQNLINFYRIMSNGRTNIYKSVEQMDKNYIHTINNEIEISMEEIIFENYYKNIELIIDKINNQKKDENKEKEERNTNNEIKEKEVNEEINKEKEINENNKEKEKEINEENNKEKEINENNKEKEINENDKEKNEENNCEDIYNILIKKEEENKKTTLNELSINSNSYNFSEDISNQFEKFASSYENSLNSFIHFILRQREHIISYLTGIQNEYIIYLNRKTDKNILAEIYINKYNLIMNNHPNLLNNPKVYNELMNDIEDVGKSIWLNIQNKKNEDVKYLKDIRETDKIDNELKKFWEYVIIVFESEVKKYLITCEIIIKYYLHKIGLLGNILGIFENSSKANQLNEYLFKINHLKYLFNGINIPEYLFNININEEEMIDNNKKNEMVFENEKEVEINDKNELNKENKNNSDFKNEKNNGSMKLNEKEKTIEEKVEILFMNSLKIIIRQDLLMKQYKEKIKNFNPNNEKEIKNSKIKLLNTSTSSKSSRRKSRLNKLSKNGIMFYEEELSYQIKCEKQKFKYRLMFLKYFIPKYNDIIINCYNDTFNAMDDWIIMSVRSQNNSLNEFIFYLKKALTKTKKKVSLEDFEFDNFDIYRRYKIDICSIFEKMNLNSIVNLNNRKLNEIALINENDMSYEEQFVYNIYDVVYIYNYLKTFGTKGCEYLIKYEIVKEILIHRYFSRKKYGDLSNINNNFNKNNSENELISNEINNNSEKNNNINAIKQTNTNLLYNVNEDENNGISKKLLFISNTNYINFLNKFSEYNNKYININDLFTCLILIGSELITSQKFIEQIKSQLKEKIISKHIYLSKEEFISFQFWFENDIYLNIYNDKKEEELFNEERKNNINLTKIQKIKESLFDINVEEGKIDLNKIIKLLDKFNTKKKEIKDNEKEEEGNESVNKIIEKENEEKKENEEEMKKENKEENEEEKEKENDEEKEKIKEKENEKENDEEKEKEEIKEGVEEEINKEEDNIDKIQGENAKSDENNTEQNDSENLRSSSKIKKNKRRNETSNNIFNAMFFN